MVCEPPPIQEQPVAPNKLFPQTWIKWFQDICNRITALEEAGGGMTTGFGETSVANNIPYIEGNCIYDFVPSNFREFTSGTGTTGAEDRMFKVTTGTGVGGYGAIQSFRDVSARLGASMMFRGSGLFESNVANSWQGLGMISIGDEVSFGYNGTDFGVWHRYGGLAEVRTIKVTGAAGGSETLTLTLNGVAYSIPLTAGTVQHNAWEIADWLNDSANQSIWDADQLDDEVIISALSDGAKSGTYSYSSSTSTGTITQNTAGVTKTSDFVAQSDWNGTNISTLDPSKGNLYQITYQNMGFGCVEYSIMNPKTCEWTLVHTVKKANTATTTTLGNPSLRCGLYCVSLGSTTDLVVRAEAFAAFVQGTIRKTRNPRAYSATQAISGTTETAILTIRNRKTYNHYTNQVEIEPLLCTVSNETSRNAVVRIRATQNTGLEQNFQNVGTNLVSDVDDTAINFTGGRLLASESINPSGEIEIDLQSLQIEQPPSLRLVVTVERVATGGSNNNFTAAVTWYENV